MWQTNVRIRYSEMKALKHPHIYVIGQRTLQEKLHPLMILFLFAAERNTVCYSTNITISIIYAGHIAETLRSECVALLYNFWMQFDEFRSMMTSSNEYIIRVTVHLCMEFTGHRWIPRTKASDALLFSLICVWINGWVNNREAGDLRRYRALYDVTVMLVE